jgi:hypothetical protein
MTKRAVFWIGVVAALAATAVSAMVARADDPRFGDVHSSLSPSIVNAGSDVLYSATWQYIDNRTLTHASVVITVPDGWTLVPPSKPTGCTQSSMTITCDRGTIRGPTTITQDVELQTDAVPLDTQTVTSELVFYEGPFNPGRSQHVANDPASTTVISADQSTEPNRAGKCVSENGGSLSTATGVGGSSTSALVPSTTALCTPVSIIEEARDNATEGCFTGSECVTDLVTTDAPAGSTGSPIKLTIIFYGTGLNNLPLFFNGGLPDELIVPACTGPDATPDPCYFGHRGRMQSVTWSVNWSGRDPIWTS